MTMIEWVARALLKAHYERGRGIPPTWDAIDKFERIMWMISARAAIEAMRDPTEAEVANANREAVMNTRYQGYSLVAGGWRAMIDAALAETT